MFRSNILPIYEVHKVNFWHLGSIMRTICLPKLSFLRIQMTVLGDPFSAVMGALIVDVGVLKAIRDKVTF